MPTPIPITNLLQQEDSQIPIRTVVLKSDQFSIPVITTSYKNCFLYAISLAGRDSSYIEMVDYDGNLVAHNTIPYSSIGKFYSEGDQLVAVAQLQNQVHILLFDTNLGIRKNIPFVRNNLVIGPLPFSVNNKISLLWTEGFEKTDMYLYQLENEVPGSIKKIGEFKNLVYEISICPHTQNTAAIWYTTGDKLNLEMMLLEKDNAIMIPGIISEYVFGLQSFITDNKINVSWITRNGATRTSSIMLAGWDAGQIKPNAMDTLIHLTQPHSVFSVSFLPAESDGFAMDLLVNDISNEHNPAFHKTPGVGKKHFLLKYTNQNKLIKKIATFEPPEIIYHNCCILKDHLLFLHGNDAPELSIYHY